MRSHFTRHRAVRAFAALAVLAGMLSFSNPASAVHNTVFELEGNVADSPSGVPWDWETFFDPTAGGARITPLPANFLDSGFDADHAFPDSSTFTSGSKDTLNISGWSCTDSNNLGGKFDILNAYSTIYEDTNGDLLLFFGIERAATEGDGNMGFWFLKDGSVDCEKPVGSKGKAPAFTGNHVAGDIFVTASFSNGGTEASVTGYKWIGGADGHLDVDNPFVEGELCGTGTHTACGIVNTTELNTGWDSPDKNGGDLDVNAFYEGFVKVPVADVSGCFATFVANTRSSTSPTATIMDFSRGSFPTCAPSTELKLKEYKVNGGTAVTSNSATPSITVYKGDSLELFFAEKNDGNLVLEKPTNTGLVVIPNSAQSSACTLAYDSGDTDTDGKFDPNETWVYKCTISIGDTTPTTLVAYGHGIDVLTAPPAKKDVTYCTETVSDNPALAPATTRTCDADERTTVSLTILAPSTQMFASATLDIIFYEENDGGAPLTRPGDGDYVRQIGTVCDTIGPVVQTSGFIGKNVGDTDGDDVLDAGEKWQWKCTVTLGSSTTTSGTKTAGAIGHGLSGNFDVTFCTNGTSADQPAKLGDNTTNATALCDPQERRRVTLTIE